MQNVHFSTCPRMCWEEGFESSGLPPSQQLYFLLLPAVEEGQLLRFQQLQQGAPLWSSLCWQKRSSARSYGPWGAVLETIGLHPKSFVVVGSSCFISHGCIHTPIAACKRQCGSKVCNLLSDAPFPCAAMGASRICHQLPCQLMGNEGNVDLIKLWNSLETGSPK